MKRSEFIKKTIKGKTLDVGCAGKNEDGSTSLHEYISREHNEDIYGLDIVDCPNMKNFKKGDAQNMPFDDNFFDTVVAGEVIEHLENPEKFLNEARRVLKDDGIIIITTPNKKSLVNRIFRSYYRPAHRNLMDIPTVKNIVSKHFVVEEMFFLPYDSDTVESLHPRLYWFRKLVHNLIPQALQENIIIVGKKEGRGMH